MKGLTHFIAGIAAASCFPAAVQAGADGNPLYFILGGAFGMLPDTIDFKFSRFFRRHDMEIIPDPDNPDPRMIADAVAYAVNRAHAEGKPLRVKLNTIRLGADHWQRYTVRFDVTGRRVVVRYGPIVSTGRVVIEEGKSSGKQEASAGLACPIVLDYQATNTIDIFDGPMFAMTPVADGRIRPEFIPWHREWSHSLMTGLVAALAGTVLCGWLAGAVMLAAWSTHVLLDQLGFMGSGIFYPFRKSRAPGLGLTHSGEGFPNFLAVWLSGLLVFWNLYRAVPGPVPDLNLVRLLAYGALLPLGAFILFDRLLRRKRDSRDIISH